MNRNRRINVENESLCLMEWGTCMYCITGYLRMRKKKHAAILMHLNILEHQIPYDLEISFMLVDSDRFIIP